MAVHTVDLKLSRDLEKFGSFDISACFNCGNCTAVCQLSEGTTSFPRRLIRYGQLGMRDKLVSAKEMWLCWSCRDCSNTCPRQARPSEYVEAARRYAIASYDRTSIARRLYTSGPFTIVFALLIAALFALILMSGGGRMAADELALFDFIPFELIHDFGYVVMGIMGLFALFNLITLVGRVVSSVSSVTDSQEDTPQTPAIGRAIYATREVIGEIVAQKRFRECSIDDGKPLVLRPWFVHYTMLWGFIGLLAATIIDYVIKTPGSFVPIWYPPRLLGTLAGLAFTYGVTVTMIRRSRPVDRTASRMVASDWLFLWLLLSVGVLGFVVEVAEYWSSLNLVGYMAFLVHVALAMELLILFPFTKFSHALYRPVALWLLKFRQGQGEVESAALT